jgi:hypothetical protein
MFSKSHEVISKTLRRDIYRLHASEFPIKKVELLVPALLAVVQYSCLYWVDHLLNCNREDTTNDLKDSRSVYQFLRTIYIYWLKALSLIKSLPDGIVIIIKLEILLQVSYTAFFKDITKDSLINKRRPIKVLIYMRLYMIQSGSPFITDQ